MNLNAAVRRVDLNAAAATLDLDALVATVDLNTTVRRVDLDPAVRRVDVDAVVERVDLEAIIARVDLAGIAREVIDEIDLPEIVRDSTGALSTHAVRSLRADGMRANDVLADLIDRVLRRKRPDPVEP